MGGLFRVALARISYGVGIWFAMGAVIAAAGCSSAVRPGSAAEADGGANQADAGRSFDGGSDATIASDAMLEGGADAPGADSDALAMQTGDGSDAASLPCPDEPLPNDCSMPNQVCVLTMSRTARCLGGTWVVCSTLLGAGCGVASGPPEGASCCEDDYTSYPSGCCVGGHLASCGDRHLHYGASCDLPVGGADAMADAQDDAIDSAQDALDEAQDAATTE
jgi:hypothetical protein